VTDVIAVDLLDVAQAPLTVQGVVIVTLAKPSGAESLVFTEFKTSGALIVAVEMQ
jgi:hypothetical protein